VTYRDLSDAEVLALLQEHQAAQLAIQAELGRRLEATRSARQAVLATSRDEERLTVQQYAGESGTPERTLRQRLAKPGPWRGEIVASAGASTLPRRRWRELMSKESNDGR
jgi:hypothetical protein